VIFFESAEWVYELKHDGFRALAHLNGGRCCFVSRRGNEMKRFNDLSGSIAKELKVTDAILDGEIVALDGDGMPAFCVLMKRRCQPVYYAFDILWLNGRDLRELSLLERKKILRSVIPRKSAWIGYVSYVDRDALKLFELVKKKRPRRGFSGEKKRRQIQTRADALVQNPKSRLHTKKRSAGVFPKAVSFPRLYQLERVGSNLSNSMCNAAP